MDANEWDDTEFDVWIVVDTEGSYSTGRGDDEARRAYETNVGPLASVEGFRMVKITVKVPLPKTVEMTGTVPETDEPSNLTVKEQP